MKARRTQEFRLGVSVLMAGADISGLSSRAQLAIVSEAIRRVKGKSLAKRIWTPQPGAQYDGYICEADELFYGGSAGGGKDLSLDTEVPTPSGWTTIGDIQPGDQVFDENGVICDVLAVSPVMFNRDVYRLRFDDGSEILAGDTHQWRTLTDKERQQNFRRTEQFRSHRKKRRKRRGTGKKQWLSELNSTREYKLLAPTQGGIRTTTDIRETLFIRGTRRNHTIPLTAPILTTHKELEIPPYVLGAWLGDGNRNNGAITSADPEVIDEIRDEGFIVNKTGEKYAYGILDLKRRLRKYNLLKNKHIPDAYLRASYHQRLMLLQGLMDTDGTCNPDGKAEFYSSNLRLVYQVHELLQTLGIKCSVKTKKPVQIGDKTYGESYRIGFRTTLPVFRLPRKLLRQPQSVRTVAKHRYIQSVDPVESVPTKCIQVSSDSGMFLVGRSFIPTHNSDLLLGLALAHRNSIIFRRQFAHLKVLTSRSKEILRHIRGASYNGQLRIWNGLPGDRTLEFGAVQYEEDKENYQGQAHDLKAFDEITQFTETQYLYLTAWNRSAVKGQRSRIVCTGNPPQYESGQWVIERWGAWLDPKHPNPAQPGELRWYTMIDSEEQEFEDGTPFTHNGEQITPKSRTFIPASLSDNAYLRDTDYRARLQSLPEPLRSQLLFGDFQIGFQDHAFQVIPTEWVYAAMHRRTDPAHRRDEKIPLTSLGVDVARGGEDQTIIVKVFGDWVDELTKQPGTATPDGSIVADYVEAEHQGQAIINIDSIGIGASPFDILNERGLPVKGINAGERSEVRDKTDEFGFRNKRAEMWWRLREMLEPGSGRELVLPDDRELLGDLCAPRYKPTSQGIQIESKDDIKKRLGRSTDCGDALVMALHEHMPMPPPASSSYSVSIDDLLAG